MEDPKVILEKVGREIAEKHLVDALREAGVNRPEYHAALLRDRVRADLAKGVDTIQVLTPQGTPAVDERGEPLTVDALAEQFAREHPDFLTHPPAGAEGRDRPARPLRKTTDPRLSRDAMRARADEDLARKVAETVGRAMNQRP